VGTQLVRRGRQPLAFIVRETGLEPGQVRDALVVLIQHRLVWHYTSIEGTRPVTYYQTRPGMLYHQLRFGTILYCATQWFDQEVSEEDDDDYQ
jgi:DNA-directed RNA polymerase III subunit RPC3